MYLIVQKITTKALSIAETSVPSNDIKEQHSLEIKNALKQHVESSRLKKEKSLVWKLISELKWLYDNGDPIGDNLSKIHRALISLPYTRVESARAFFSVNLLFSPQFNK